MAGWARMGRVRTVLVTGAEGQVGRAATAQMEAAGWTVRRFDLTTGQDLRDEGSVRRAVSGCDAVVHAGAIPHDTMGSPADILATNVLGTWHLLLAAEAVGCSRFVYFSSAQVFGFAEGEGTPEYLPVDDEHPLRAARPYGMSKRLAETMCEAWTARTGIPTVVLRPVLILSDERFRNGGAADAELGAFVHVDDVADAVVKALSVPLQGHIRLILCGPGPFDTAATRRALGWQPTRSGPTGR
jgi:UDP-glucose 4-epimerase